MKKRVLIASLGLMIGGMLMMRGSELAKAATQTIVPAQIKRTDPEITNPLRGQYAFLTSDYTKGAPANWPLQDSYNRFTWRQVEPTPGNYDFRVIEDGLASAAAQKGKFGFRIMPLCVDCGPNLGNALPADIAQHASTWQWTDPANGTSYAVPDWNNEYYLARWSNLMKALGDRFANDPRLGFIDFGGYGTWGEQHQWPIINSYPGPNGQLPASVSAVQRIHKAVIDNFPNTYKALNPPQMLDQATNDGSATNSAAVMNYALLQSMNVGIRKDCIGGGTDMQWATYAVIDAAQSEAVANGVATQYLPSERWKYAPSITEWCNNISPTSGAVSSFSRGLEATKTDHFAMLSSSNWVGGPSITAYSASEQAAFVEANRISGYRYTIDSLTVPSTVQKGKTTPLTVNWNNLNVAPTYTNWNVTYQVRNQNGQVVATTASPLNLRQLYPGQPKKADTLSLATANLPVGKYSIYVIAKDARNYSSPLRLAISGRGNDGAYRLAGFSITTSSAPTAPTTGTAPVASAPTTREDSIRQLLSGFWSRFFGRG